MNTALDPDDLYRYITTHWDLQGYSRAQWRALSRGRQRPRLRDSLVQLAETLSAGAKSDRLALYKAAHATLPLHGQPLLDFMRLLVEERPPSLEWTDAMLSLLAERTPGSESLEGKILMLLGQIYAQPTGSRAEQCKVQSICAHVRLLGYRPDWLPPPPEVTLSPTPMAPPTGETTTLEAEMPLPDDDPQRREGQETSESLPHLEI